MGRDVINKKKEEEKIIAFRANCTPGSIVAIKEPASRRLSAYRYPGNRGFKSFGNQ